MQKFGVLYWLCFQSLVELRFNPWRLQDSKCKVPILIPLFSQSLTWSLSRSPLVFCDFRAVVSIVAFLLAGIGLDMAHVLGFILILLYHFGGVDPRGGMTSSTAFWIAYIFLRGLGLGLSLRLICISRSEIMAKLSLVISMISTRFVFLSGSVALCAPRVGLLCSWRWLETGFCFYIDGFLHYFFPQI